MRAKVFGDKFLFYVGLGIVSLMATSLLGAHQASAASYAEAMAEADGWCSEWDNKKPVGLYKAISGYGWLTGSDGSNTIVADAGVESVPVRVNFAGRHCRNTLSWQVLYMSNQEATINGSSNLLSGAQRMVSADEPANHASPSNYHRTSGATLNIKNLPVGQSTYTVCMHWVANNNYSANNTDVTITCNDISITKKAPWTINGQSYIRKSTDVADSQGTINNITPGTRLYWTHDLRASAVMDKDITYRVDKSGFSNGWNTNKDPTASVRYLSGDTLFVKISPPSGSHTVHDVTQADVGNKLCQRISWAPNSYNDSGRGQATYVVNGVSLPTACADVPYNFNLKPSIDPLGAEFADQGGSIPTVSAKVANSGPTKSYIDIQWQLSTIIVKPGDSIEEVNEVDNLQNGCAYYRNTCTTLDGRGSGEGDTSFGVKTTTVRQLLDQQVGDLEVGSKLCYGMSIKAYRPGLVNASPNWRHSPAECVIVGKKPKIQVWGGDLSVGRYFAGDTSTPSASIIETSVSVKDNNTKTFGSWVEYGVFASGTITGASAAGLAGNSGNTSRNQSDWSKLTFANAGHTTSTGCNGVVKFGCFSTAGSMGTIPDVAARLAPGGVTGSPQVPNNASVDSLDGTYYSSAGSLTINGGTVAKGKSVVIKSAGTVRINGDIGYAGDTLSTVNEIPQMVIIANNIIIEENVTNVDAWLIAKNVSSGVSGNIYTCGAFKAVLTSQVCNKQLTINGPVMSKKLYLQRTAGSGTGDESDDPAEILNLRADAYLWAIGRSGGLGSVQTIDTRELAPRF